MDFFRRLFVSDFMPHGHCFFWQPSLLWLHVSSDLLIALAYFLIPFALAQLFRKRPDLDFHWMFVMFGIFILSCGMTHLMNVWDIWHSAYRLEGVVKAITGIASIVTAIVLFRLLPLALEIPSPKLLRSEVAERKRAEAEVRVLNADLERRVEERTATLKRTNAALQRYAYIASHDLQEPIRTIKSMNQLLARQYQGQLDVKADQYLSFVVEATDRLQNLVSDLMTYARVLDENAPRVVKAVRPELLLDQVLSDLKHSIEENAAVISVERLAPVYADPTHLKQVFQNLISNAIKYHRPDITPEIKIFSYAEGKQAVFCVQDNGIGVPAEYSERIFVAFRRLHGRELPGSGVGLTICKDIVEQYNGKIWIQSEVGKGSTFYFSVPSAQADGPTGSLVEHDESVNV